MASLRQISNQMAEVSEDMADYDLNNIFAFIGYAMIFLFLAMILFGCLITVKEWFLKAKAWIMSIGSGDGV